MVAHSARSRFSGLITRVLRDTVMAQVEIQVRRPRFVALLSSKAADEPGVESGRLVVAAVKSTNVSAQIPDGRPPRRSAPIGEARRAG